MTKNQRFNESKQSSSNCKKAMHDLDGASDQDIMFGHARDVTISYSLSTSFGKDLIDSHKNSDVPAAAIKKARLDQRSRETRVKENGSD